MVNLFCYCKFNLEYFSSKRFKKINPKTAGGGRERIGGGGRGRRGEGSFDPSCGFSENVSSKERVKPWVFVTFNIIISQIVSENFIEIPQVVRKI